MRHYIRLTLYIVILLLCGAVLFPNEPMLQGMRNLASSIDGPAACNTVHYSVRTMPVVTGCTTYDGTTCSPGAQVIDVDP